MKYSGAITSIVFFCLTLISIGYADEQAVNKKSQVELLAPGYGELNFEVPKAGSYELPALGYAKDAKVLNIDNEYVTFHNTFNKKYTVLSFMYTQCDDVNGCPLTNVVFNRIVSEMEKTPELAKQMQLVSMSFDPKNDTPAVLKKLSMGGMDHSQHEGHDMSKMDHDMGNDNNQTMQWHYLTTNSQQSLMPILNDYNQAIQNKTDENGKELSTFSHILRVYLVDTENKLRNVYSTAFLHPDIIINDIKTLILEDNMSSADPLQAQTIVRMGPGDSKKGYDTVNYKTDSLALTERKGQQADLQKLIISPPLGLPKVPVPLDNPVTESKIQLGKKLFYDRRLSLNNTVSCAMCHIAEQGFTNNELQKSIGFEGRSVKRNAPTMYNVAYYEQLFHDGRESTLENQVWQPLLAHNEMALPSIGQVIAKIKSLEDYDLMFEQAFDGQQADVKTIGQSIASYERTLVSANSPFDEWYFGKKTDVISESAQRGFKLFSGKAQCIACHTIKEDHALFTDNLLHNTGLGWNVAMRKEPEKERMLIAPGIYMDIKKSIKDEVGNKALADLGRYEVTQNPDDRWSYRTPILRNVALTAPYMHDGSIASLEAVVEFYNQGGFKNKNQSPLMNTLNLTKDEVQDIVEFLKTLTGDNVSELVSDAYTAPVGDTRH